LFVFSGQFAEVYKCHLKNRQISRAVKCIPKGVSEKKNRNFIRMIEMILLNIE